MEHRIFETSFADIHRLYVAKAERKGHTRDEVDDLICWLTGHDAISLQTAIDDGRSLRDFFEQAPAMTPHTDKITGLVCGVRVEDVADPLMQKIRWMDKLIDELARGKKTIKRG